MITNFQIIDKKNMEMYKISHDSHPNSVDHVLNQAVRPTGQAIPLAPAADSQTPDSKSPLPNASALYWAPALLPLHALVVQNWQLLVICYHILSQIQRLFGFSLRLLDFKNNNSPQPQASRQVGRYLPNLTYLCHCEGLALFIEHLASRR